MNESNGKGNWSKVAEECRNRYNETNHSVTGFSPKYLLSGESTDLLPNELKERQLLTKSLEEDRKVALKRSIKSHEYNKTLFAKNRLQHDFKKGDKPTSTPLDDGRRAIAVRYRRFIASFRKSSIEAFLGAPGAVQWLDAETDDDFNFIIAAAAAHRRGETTATAPPRAAIGRPAGASNSDVIDKAMQLDGFTRSKKETALYDKF
ncbi:hypothetical protein EVAR_2357_1 [Eumeta japonica]|uniref:Uncharacterized protein n=1 Tax=Eumeta variegata TaxID=151549 RepID=A0A4C1SG90_EUMVA|nr:hypothetical protein EVAR_2357_1 [Eumeta japonica]